MADFRAQVLNASCCRRISLLSMRKKKGSPAFHDEAIVLWLSEKIAIRRTPVASVAGVVLPAFAPLLLPLFSLSSGGCVWLFVFVDAVGLWASFARLPACISADRNMCVIFQSVTSPTPRARLPSPVGVPTLGTRFFMGQYIDHFCPTHRPKQEKTRRVSASLHSTTTVGPKPSCSCLACSRVMS